MSHFAVGIISSNKEQIEQLLAPYNENISVEPYISVTKAQLIEKAKKRKLEFQARKEKGEEISDWMQRFFDAETDEQFYQCEYDEDERYDESGNLLSTYNPKSKWDWWQIGGRWGGFILKDGTKACQSKISDIDLSLDKDKYNYAIRYWEINVENSPLVNGEQKNDYFCFYNPQYFIEQYGTKENYAKSQAYFITFALITLDGVWHEKGKMSWFGADSATSESRKSFKDLFEKTLKEANPEHYFTLVDCHI